MQTDTEFMRRALELAAQAAARGEVPVGALVTQGERVLGEGFNQPIELKDPTAHAEVLAMRAAAAALNDYRLAGTTLYVTLEPCPMCAAALVHARVGRLVFGAWDPRQGAAGSVFNLVTSPQMNHRLDVFGGVLGDECGAVLKNFFASRR
jgi:tRNA(adenine34) deaminase